MSTLRFYKGNITSMTGNNIFVYGANPEFRNGKGAALLARQFGAKRFGGGRGIVGNTYGLITKNLIPGFVEPGTGLVYEKSGYQSVSPQQIRENILELYETARQNPEKTFFIAYTVDKHPNGRLKKSLNGYTSKDMWEFFTKDIDVPENIRFHNSFRDSFINHNI